MGRRTERAAAGNRQREGRPPFTALAYLAALVVAMFLCGALGPGGLWRPSGLQKEYRPYLVLELPVAREGIAQGFLTEGEDEFPPPHQKLMKRGRFTPAEYARWLRDYPWEGDHLRVRQDGVEYEVYFVPAGEGTTRVPIPVGYEYFLSGDGEDGFIVTVTKKEETS